MGSGNFLFLNYEVKELIKEIQRLPISKGMLLVERALKSIRETEIKAKMENAGDTLLNDYKNDKRLTASTSIDFENFYEAR